ncbi:uncharacterized protein Z518_05946 [Rhinocladiella mackenziei CBS 650.93]|uniref:Uncharacterized protein n=1 Tax=Rhinocladiella mackenziei CBS 650.93 TaxID=1442369 RepID=A0A0D2IH40_9EURO|nr:uncharacterized protein Z518_05946 [Rhinocladiella mackenziei CBS 650.93]KIX05074.1 hypothetical protein Z518_05946 [Rhinocladiella mackenziei CBS 650.93]
MVISHPATLSGTGKPHRRQTSSIQLVDPSTFMSQANKIMSSLSRVSEQPQAQGPSPSEVIHSHENVPALPYGPNQPFTQNPDQDIRKVPVDELAYPINAVIRPAEISTHTHGAPNLANLSDFSGSLGVHESPAAAATHPNTHADTLVGLGIEGIDTQTTCANADFQPTDVTSLKAEQCKGGTIESTILSQGPIDTHFVEEGKVLVDGVRYIPESELLQKLDLKEALVTAFKDIDSRVSSSQKSDSERVDSKRVPVKQLESKPGIQLSLISTTSMSSNVVQSIIKANPFSPREPIPPAGTADKAPQSSP